MLFKKNETIKRKTRYDFSWTRKKNLKNDTIESIATALNVNPAFLMGWIDESDEQPQHRAAHLEGELTDEEWQRVLDYADYIRSKRK